MKKILNKNYREFLDEGVIQLITIDHVKQALLNVKGVRGKHKEEGAVLLLVLYFTGARPNEVLRMRAKDVQKEGSFVTFFIRGSKGGLPRKLEFQAKNPFIMRIYKYAMVVYPDAYLFFHYQSKYRRTVKTRKGIITRREYSSKLRYYVNKWFEGVLDNTIPPYFLRHSRFSTLIQNHHITESDIKFLKGSRSMDSVTPYLHMSKAKARKLARYIK